MNIPKPVNPGLDTLPVYVPGKPIEDVARELGLAELLTLSTQAFTYFQSKAGFSEGTPDDLPPARREKYDQSGRKSKVLVKKLK